MINILISGNSGQGKTTIAVNIAVALAQFGNPVQLINIDAHTPKLHYHFGLPYFTGTYRRAGLDIRIGTAPVPETLGILDTPSSALRSQNGRIILVTSADFPSIYETLKLIKRYPVSGIILNNFENASFEMSQANIEEFTDRPVLATISQDSQFRYALKQGHPYIELCPDKPNSSTFKQVAANLMNEHYTILS